LLSRDVIFIAEVIDVGELGLALDQMPDALSEDLLAVSPTRRADMLAPANRLSLGERVCMSRPPVLS
jgi:hypothetical protein